MIFLWTFHNWKKLSAKEMNWLKIVWCKGHRRKEKIYDRRTLQSILWRRTYSRRVGVWKDPDQGPGLTFVSSDLPRWTSARRAPSVRPLQCSRASLKRFALLTLVALWPTSVRLLPSSISLWSTVRTVIRRLFHPAELVFLQMGQMGLRFGCQGFSPSKRKVGAQLGAHGWALSVGGHKNFPKCKFVFPKWRLWACWPELGWSCIAFCLSLRVFSCVLFQFDPCSCILAMLLFGCLSCHSFTRSTRL